MTASIGKGEYLVIVGGVLHRYEHFDRIPDVFDNIVKFLPEIPPGPHTHEQHEEIDRLSGTFRRLMEKEHARGNSNR